MKGKLYNPRDNKLFEDLAQKYTPAELLNVINDIKSKNPVVQQSEQDLSEREAILDFIRKVEGFRVRLREMHWETTSKAAHLLTDDLMSSLTDYEDSIAEDAMGAFGFRIKVGDIVPIMPEELELNSLLPSLTNLTISLKQKLEKSTISSEFSGIISILDDMIHDLNKGKYLETIK